MKNLLYTSVLPPRYRTKTIGIFGQNLSEYVAIKLAAFCLPFPFIFIYQSLPPPAVCVSSLYSWFIHNGLVLNTTITEASYFDTIPRLQSLSHQLPSTLRVHLFHWYTTSSYLVSIRQFRICVGIHFLLRA